jgi:tetratricopeptide (TPR) repeat protein
LEKSGQHYKAVNLILKKEKKITNQISKYETLARNYEKLGKPEKAIESLNALLQICSANASYYWKVLELKGIPKPKDANDILSESEQEGALKVLNFYQGMMPKSVMPRRLILQVAVGPEFKKELEAYIRPQVEKGVPSMLKDLRNLYINEEKRNAIFELLTKFNTNLEKQMTLCEEDE